MIKVEICTGTTCFVMGGAELLMLEESLPESLADRVEIQGTSCMEHCKSNPAGEAPYARVNGKLIKQASIHNVITELKRITGEE
ncbi:MAG: (2Fe-2S) ferredoxin domain-containing protein [candidate division KSB1 bacterium]|nr:(2Fe-2S) ferredoxin domain-containing protein [candidate division KSB1 bacterium]